MDRSKNIILLFICIIISELDGYKQKAALFRFGIDDHITSGHNNIMLPSGTVKPHLAYLFSHHKGEPNSRLNKDMLQHKAPPNLNDYVRVISKYDINWLNSTAESIKRQLNIDADITPMRKSMLYNYVNNINRHLESLKRIYSKRSYDAAEKDLVFINLVDAFNKVLYNELKLFLNNIVDTYKNVLDRGNIDQVSESIYFNSIQHKRDELRMLCLRDRICRPFPAFSDYLADFCSEIIKLSDEKLAEFVKKLYVVVKGKADFYRYNIGKQMFTKLGDKMLNLIKGDLYDVREAVSVLRGLITQRFYPIENSDQKVEEKTKAGRTLIDIMDRTFSREDETTMSINFDSLMKSLRDWAVDFRNDLESILFTNIVYVTEALEKHWNSRVREQTRTLLRVLLRDDYVVISL